MQKEPLRNILIVDDEPDILELMEEEFDLEGFKVTCTDSGNKALSILKNNSQHFDVIISDFKMSDGDGSVVLDFVRRKEGHRPLFYFVSGQADISSSEAQSLGVKRFIYKPFDVDELIQKIAADLEER